MEIQQAAAAGTMESSDVMVMVQPNPNRGLEITINSVVLTTFGRQIRRTVEDVLTSLHVTDAIVELTDKGAIDCVVRARTIAAICRAAGEKFDWEGVDGNA